MRFLLLCRVLALASVSCVLLLPVTGPAMRGDAMAQDADTLLAQARAAADAQDHERAIALFAQARTLSPDRGPEWAREEADQTAFAGRPADAVQLYFRALSRPGISSDERDRAARGLAFALLWSGQASAAADALEGVLAVSPDDQVARQALAQARAAPAAQPQPQPSIAQAEPAAPQPVPSLPSTEAASPAEPSTPPPPAPSSPAPSSPAPSDPAQAALAGAREAASTGDNRRSAQLFAEVLALNPALFPSIAREYADQLAYSGDPAAAVPVYRRALDEGAVDDDARLRRGLAFALLWSGETQAAVQELAGVVAAAPDDEPARQALVQAQVSLVPPPPAGAPPPVAAPPADPPPPAEPVAPAPPAPAGIAVANARQAASTGDNQRAAALFAQALVLDPDLFGEIGGEYADQTAFAGDPARAVGLYRRVLAEAPGDAEQRASLQRRLAFAQLWSGDFTSAIVDFQRILNRSPGDEQARTALGDAYIGAARAAAGRGDNARSAELFAQTLVVAPERRRLLLREYADQRLFAGQPLRARALYEEWLAYRDLDVGERQLGLLGLARSFAWNDQHEKAVPVYDLLLALAPGDVDGLVGRGQSLNALRYHARAFADFTTALSFGPGNEEAVRGAAQSESSLGRNTEALERLRPLLEGPSPDPRTLAIAGNASRALGRPDRAREIADAILRIAPGDAAGASLLAALDDDARPVTRVLGETVLRSDRLRIASMILDHTIVLNDGLTTVAPQLRAAAFRQGFVDAELLSAGLSFAYRANDVVSLRSSVLLNQELLEFGEESLRLTHDSGLGFRLNDTWTLEAQAVRRYADEDPEVFVNDLLANDWGGRAVFTPRSNLQFSAAGLWSDYTDDNSRLWGQADAAVNVLERGWLWLGFRATAFEFDRATDSGYWNPGRYHSLVGTLHSYGSPAPGWWVDVQGTLGYAESVRDGDGITSSISTRISRQLSERASLEFNGLYQHSRARLEGATLPEQDPFQRAVLDLAYRLRW